MPHYLLSSNQQKELLIRKQKVKVALPAPPEDAPDLVAWARSVLPRELSPLVRSAEQEIIEVVPKVYSAPAPQQNLTDVLGAIVGPTPPAPGLLIIGVDAVVVLLAPDNPRGGPAPMKWPGNVIIGGKKLIDRN